jgi:hypothetical protein
MKLFFRGIVVVAFALVAAAQQTVAGEWLFTAHDQFGPNVMRMTLSVTGDKLTGTLGGRTVEGVVRGTTIELNVDNATFKGGIEPQGISGDATFPTAWSNGRPSESHSVRRPQGHMSSSRRNSICISRISDASRFRGEVRRRRSGRHTGQHRGQAAQSNVDELCKKVIYGIENPTSKSNTFRQTPKG